MIYNVKMLTFITMPGSKNWCFTLNNYTEEDINRIDLLITTDNRIVYVLYGKEVASTGTRHLQGFIQFNVRLTLQNVKNIIGSEPHVSVTRNVNASRNYCKKEGDWVEHGIFGGGQGSRSDLEMFKDSVKTGILSLKTLREMHSEVFAKYPRFAMEYVQDNYPQVDIPNHPLKPWQENLKQILEQPPDRRKVIFLVDTIGNSGKSWFSHYYAKLLGDGCQVLIPGKKTDMAYALRPGLKVVFLDAPRSRQGDFIQYDFLEELKTGYIFSPKYESRIKTYEPLHVVVNMNEQPDMTKLSPDRYQIINLNPPGNYILNS